MGQPVFRLAPQLEIRIPRLMIAVKSIIFFIFYWILNKIFYLTKKIFLFNARQFQLLVDQIQCIESDESINFINKYRHLLSIVSWKNVVKQLIIVCRKKIQTCRVSKKFQNVSHPSEKCFSKITTKCFQYKWLGF